MCVFHHGFKVVVQTPWQLSQWALEAAGIRIERVHLVRPVGRRRLIGRERRMLPRWGSRLCVLCALESLNSNAIGGERGQSPLRGSKDGHDNDGQFDLWVYGIFYIQFDLWGKKHLRYLVVGVCYTQDAILPATLSLKVNEVKKTKQLCNIKSKSIYWLKKEVQHLTYRCIHLPKKNTFFYNWIDTVWTDWRARFKVALASSVL